MDRKKVLIVEDDEIFRHVLKSHLQIHGFEVREAENGLVAKTIMELSRFDLIVSDMNMPVMDGLQLLQYAKAGHPKSKFILMTGFSSVVESQQAYEMGADEFLAKPFRKEDLLKCLQNCLMVAPPAEEATPPDPEHNALDYCQIRITDFITGTALPADIYLRLGDEKFIKLAGKGQAVPQDRIETYRSKGIHYLHMKKEDFARYVGLNLRLFTALQGAPRIEIERKITVVRHMTDTILEQLCVNGMNRERLKDAHSMVLGTVDLLLQSEDTTKLMDILMSAGTLSEHAIAVAMISSLIAREHGWVAVTTQFKVALAGLFHDIGLKEIPPELLNKRRFEMSTSELRLFETHTTRGRAILQSVPGLPEDIAAVAAQHHERISGTGYPYRMKGDQMHPLSRLVAVADFFCEMIFSSETTKGVSMRDAYRSMSDDFRHDLDQDFVAALGRLVTKIEKTGKMTA